ncbi:MAG: stage II sporulation protein M [Bacillota bacterium]|nr:stage II sporulation protein M [Bacillota bacterium]
MRTNKIINIFNKHFQDNFWLYMISLLCISIGIILGIYTVKYMGGLQKSDLISYLNSFTENTLKGKINSNAVLVETIKNNLPLLAAIWFLGLTIIGIPIILLFDIIKGFTVGFTISFFIKGLGSKGILVSLLGVLPQNIIYIPCLLISSVLAMEFSLSILRDKINKLWTQNIGVKIVSYSISFLLILLVMGVGFILEAYLTPGFMKLVAFQNRGILV